MIRLLKYVLAISLFSTLLAAAQDSDQKKHLDISSSVGDMHLGADADARKAGLPLYPGAREKPGENSDKVNLGLLTEAFGFKLVVVNYESDDVLLLLSANF